MKKGILFLVLFWFMFFVLVFFMGATRHILTNGQRIQGKPREAIIFMSKLLSYMVDFADFSKPMLVGSPSLLKDGFNPSEGDKSSKDYLLISSWNDSIGQCDVKLVRIADQKVIYRWKPDIKQLNSVFNPLILYGLQKRQQPNDTRIIHPCLDKDGSLVFNTHVGGIAKVDRYSRYSWISTVPVHHSIEPDGEGNLWVCSYNSSNANSKKYQIMDDAIKKVSSADGKVLFEKSVFEILTENGYPRGVLFIYEENSLVSSFLDITHLNDIQPVYTDSKYWKKGDLFLSLRHQNLVMLYRPSTNKILWLKNGPWVRQHDVVLVDSAKIGVFGNDVIDAVFETENGRFLDGHNNEHIFDFATGETSAPYHDFFESSQIATWTEGRCRILPNGEIFVEESNQGRLIYGNHKKQLWSYIGKTGENKASVLNWCRYITQSEFDKLLFLKQ